MTHTRSPRNHQGSSMVEVLVASFILMVSGIAVVSMWYVSYNLSHRADYTGLAYTIGRSAMENIKQSGYQSSGFQLSSDGTTTRYYDGRGNDTTASDTGHVLSATMQLTTTNGLQTVIITVSAVGDSSALYQTSTYLVKGGI